MPALALELEPERGRAVDLEAAREGAASPQEGGRRLGRRDDEVDSDRLRRSRTAPGAASSSSLASPRRRRARHVAAPRPAAAERAGPVPGRAGTARRLPRRRRRVVRDPGAPSRRTRLPVAPPVRMHRRGTRGSGSRGRGVVGCPRGARRRSSAGSCSRRTRRAAREPGSSTRRASGVAPAGCSTGRCCRSGCPARRAAVQAPVPGCSDRDSRRRRFRDRRPSP